MGTTIVLIFYCFKYLKEFYTITIRQSKEFENFLFGSNTVWAMKHLSSPLIIVPANAKYKSIRTVGLACDFKRSIASTPIDEIRTIVMDFKADLHVLYINT